MRKIKLKIFFTHLVLLLFYVSCSNDKNSIETENENPNSESTITITQIVDCPICPLENEINFYKNKPMFVIGSKMYLYVGLSSIQKFYEFDTVADKWTEKAFPEAQPSSGLSFSIGNKGYLLSGESLYEYDSDLNTWQTKESHPLSSTDNYDYALIYQNKAYIGGNPNTNGMTSYDPSLNDWQMITVYPGNGKFGEQRCSFMLNNKIYTGGGRINTNGDTHTDFWEYDLIDNAWDKKDNIDHFLGLGITPLFNIDNKQYVYYQRIVYDQNDNYERQHELWVYDSLNDKWNQHTNFNGSLPKSNGPGYVCGFSIGNLGYILLENGTLYSINIDN